MSSPKITEKEKEALRNKAKNELERLEDFLSNQQEVQLLDEFKNNYNICETVYKVILYEHQRRKGNEPKRVLNVSMTQVPYALTFAGYSFERQLLNELFGTTSKKGKTVKVLRNEITHGINEKAVEEIIERKDELFSYMDKFLNEIRSFDVP